jgi:hypothetical protein
VETLKLYDRDPRGQLPICSVEEIYSKFHELSCRQSPEFDAQAFFCGHRHFNVLWMTDLPVEKQLL